MLTAQEIREKVFKLPEKFEGHYRNKEWSQAKAAYNTALTVSVFAEFSEKDKIALFGNKPYKEEYEEMIDGMFRERMVQRTYLECIKRNQTQENETYQGHPLEQKNAPKQFAVASMRRV